jgi:LysM repeat protein
MPRTAPVCALVLLLAVAAGLGLLAPHMVASEDEPASDEYVVHPGDTLTDIATKFGTTVQALAALNGLTDADHILTGTELTVPSVAKTASVEASRTYEVEPGDTLWGIARSLGIPTASLEELNGLAPDAQIVAGTELQLPVSTLTTTSSQSTPVRTHTVVSGETVSSIAADYSVSIAAILDANDLGENGLIRAGQVLTVPAASLPELSTATAAVLEDASVEFDIDPYLLMALSLMESGWQAGVVSHTGAIGLMQVMPDTAEWTVDYLLPSATNWHVSIEDNARVGAAYLNHLLFIEGGDVEAALASYYQGWGSYKTDGMFDETRDYVDDVLALAGRLRSEGN